MTLMIPAACLALWNRGWLEASMSEPSVVWALALPWHRSTWRRAGAGAQVHAVAGEEARPPQADAVDTVTRNTNQNKPDHQEKEEETVLNRLSHGEQAYE